MSRSVASRVTTVLRSPWVVGALVTIALLVFDGPSVQRVDLAIFDVVARSDRPAAFDDVVVVAIDEASIAALGPWPWPRGVHAAMIDRLHDAGATAIGYDILFADRSADDAAGDAALAAALARSGRVVLPIAPASERHGIAGLEPAAAFATAARSLGHVDVDLDADAIARRLFLEGGVGDRRIPAFPLAVAAIADGRDAAMAGRRAPEGAGRSRSAWTRDFEILVPHAAGSLATVPFVDVLRDPALAAMLKDRTVFVGVTATGIGSRLATTLGPTREPMAGVEFLARTFAALRGDTAIAPLDRTGNAALSLLPLLMLGFATVRPARSRSLAVAAVIALPLLISVILLHAANLWFAPFSATAGLVVGNLVLHAGRLREIGRQLFRVQQQAKAALDAIADGVVTVDEKQTIVFANPVARQLVGGIALEGVRVSDLFAEDPPHRSLVAAAIESCMAQRRVVRVEGDLVLAGTTAERRLVRVTAAPLIEARNRLEGAVLAVQDVTEAAAATARLDHAATHDALTGLPNRVLFCERLRQALGESRRSGTLLAVLFIDLDRFKRINDSLGHRCGDEVLKVIATRLSQHGRAVDMVARWGGDEFVVLLSGLSSREAVETAAQRLIQIVSQRIDLDGMELHCACSLGIALAPNDAADVDTLLAMADMAMYRGRARSSGRFEFYAPEMSQGARDRIRVEAGIRQAITEGAFELHYQTQIDLATGEPVALEALLRWRTASGDLLQPNEFIAVAEESGLILALGEWVIGEAADQIARWSVAGTPLLPVAVNVSARQCLDDGLVRTLRDVLARTGIDPHLLVLEITETTAMRDVEHAIDLLGRIAALGIRVAVDDFGTGYSSLAYLKRFPIDQLKIDQSFVRDIATSDSDAAIVVAILTLARSLGWTVVAEGVETEAQRAVLADRRCDFAQGFLFCRPLPADELAAILRERPRAPSSRPRFRASDVAGVDQVADTSID